MTSKTRRRGNPITPAQQAYREAARKPAGWQLETRLADTPGDDIGPMVAAVRGKPAAPVAPRTVIMKTDLTDSRVEARVELASDTRDTILMHDHGGNNSVAGLRLRIGARSARWLYYRDTLDHGERTIVSKSLGYWPAMDTKAAREAAVKVAAERAKPGERAAVKLGEAMDDYLVHLKAQAAKRGKAATWAKNVTSLRQHFAEFERRPLAQLSDMPREVAQWHRRVTERAGPVVANQAAKVLRAAYRRAARLDRSLPPALPTSAVEFNEESRSQNALDFGDFPKWRKAWDAIESPTRKAYQRAHILCGARPGELARLKWADVLPRERRFVIRGAKAGDDISIPLSAAIAREFKRARDAARTAGVQSDFVFYSRDSGHIVKFDCDGLPAHGMMLRRTYRTVAADLGTDELITHFLMGHRPAGISQGYIAKLVLASGGAMRKAQRDISRRVESLLAGRNGKH